MKAEPAKGYVCVADVEAEAVAWLWAGKIPRGKLTVIEGDPGEGKSTLLFDLAARVSRGAPMPLDSTSTMEPSGVVIVSAEDGIGDTIRPRLEAAEADLQRIVAFQMASLPTLPKDLQAIEASVAEVNASLVILDPFVAFLSGNVNSWKDQDIRRALTPLAALAERTGAAVVLVRHWTKADGGEKAIYRGGGSIGIAGAARSVLLVASDPENPDQKIVARVKGNLAPPWPSLAYRMVPVGTTVRIDWIGENDHQAGDLTSAPVKAEDRSAVGEAAEAILRLLEKEVRIDADEMERHRRQLGISEWAWKKGKVKAGAKADRDGFGPGGRWYWTLPATHRERPRPISQPPSSTSSMQEPASYGAPIEDAEPPIGGVEDGPGDIGRSPSAIEPRPTVARCNGIDRDQLLTLAALRGWSGLELCQGRRVPDGEAAWTLFLRNPTTEDLLLVRDALEVEVGQAGTA